MSKKRPVSKRLREALSERELAKDYDARVINGEGNSLKPLRPLTKTEKDTYVKLIGEIFSGKPRRDSITASSIDLDAPETSESYIRGQKITWAAVDSQYKPINKGQYLDQEADAYKRDITSVWEQVPLMNQPEEGAENYDTLEPDIRPLSKSVKNQLSPLRQLAVDIIKYKYDQQGKASCMREILEVYENEVSKKYADIKQLDIWKENCFKAVRTIVSSKKCWEKLNSIN